MKVKKFQASSMPEAMQQVRNELGDQAVILNQKKVERGGFLGFFKRQSIEVIAAIDPKPPKAEQKHSKPTHMNKQQEPPLRTPKTTARHPEGMLAENEDNRQKLVSKEAQRDDLHEEVKDLKKMIAGLSQQKDTSYPPLLETIHQKLEQQEVDDTLRLDMMRHLLKRWYEEESEPSEKTILQWLSSYVQQLMEGIAFGGESERGGRFINIVGPTGVGKTTTIAKMAADFQLKKKKSVALITTDTYRIAAVDQLKTYAKILNVPVSVAYSIEDFREAKANYAEYDVVLVDSAGRNFRNELYVEELKKLIDFDTEMETYLVLALTSKYQDMKQIYESFSLIPIHKLIFTKKDETTSYGAIMNMIAAYGTGIAYVTTGQNVPDDMFEATSDRMTEVLNEGLSNE
ncbi:flagellar biosynthesis protein FlhF [Salsuginibacillus kocurii]|uniref:flagellar biosynthesis protein FlhF n=1 Tax=Salsuginibacillus kocurii TaxID=427078 RepID=UPI0003816556|nr:flagellar biosynthesis protein FlhF [Salsuginibacillus kocurii]